MTSPLSPPRTIWLIRHAESAANAGQRTKTAGLIPLSDKGREQAQVLADTIGPKPDLIVTSKYLRTLETATPLLIRNPDVPQEVWNLHEFTYLNAEQYNNTTQNERAVGAKEYWERCDADYSDGRGAESFRQFIGRIDAVLEALKSRVEPFTICFTHGFVIKAVVWRAANPERVISNEAMQDFRALHQHHVVHNAQIFPFGVQERLAFQGRLHKAARVQTLT